MNIFPIFIAKPKGIFRFSFKYEQKMRFSWSLSQSKRPDISEDGIYTKKMSVDASRVDSHSNHIINNTKTNNQ